MEPFIDQTHYVGNPLAAPRCPRCGYDVSGVPAGWKEMCELRGMCSECGFEFGWRDVYRPERQLPRWLFEYAEGRWWGRFISVWKTLLMVMVPPLFFSKVKLWHVPVVKRICWWLPLMLLLAYVTVTLTCLASLWLLMQATPVNGMVSGGYRRYYASGGAQWTQYLNEIISPIGVYEGHIPLSAYRPGITWAMQLKLAQWEFVFHDLSSGICFLGAAALAWPAALLLLKPTRRLAKIRNAHVLRASVYSLWWVVLLAWISALERIAWSLDGLIETFGMGRGIGPLRRLVDSSLWQELWTPIESIADLGFAWRPGGIVLGALFLFSQVWWWHTVIVKHWRLPQGRMAFALIGVIAGCVAILAAIGPMSIRYIFMNL